MARYTARFEVDPGGEGWIVTVSGIQGCRSEGDTLPQARKRIREALSLFVDDAEEAEIEEEYVLPAGIRRTLARQRKAKARAEAAAAEAGELLRSAVAQLTELGLTRRDVAAVVGVSFQRVQQLVPTDGIIT